VRHCVSYLVVGIELISVGSLRTEVGREAEEIVGQGGLLPDDMVLKVVTSKLDRLHNKVRQTLGCHGPCNLSSFAALDIRRFPSYTWPRQTSRQPPKVRVCSAPFVLKP